MGLFGSNVEKMERKRDVEGLIEALTHKDLEVRDKAQMALVRIGEPAVELLIRTLKDKTPHARALRRAKSARALGDIGDARAVEALIRATNSTYEFDELVRVNAAEALGKIGDARAVEALIEAAERSVGHLLIRTADDQAASAAARALGNIRDQKAVEPLIKAMGHYNPEVRKHAAEALGNIKDARAVKPLLEALADVDTEVNLYAKDALTKIGGTAVVDGLIECLKEEPKGRNAKHYAAIVLGEIADVKAVQPLVQALNDRDTEVRRRAATALGKIGDVMAVEPLVQALNKATEFPADAYLQHCTIEALGRIGGPAVETLIELLENKDDDVRYQAVKALGETGDTRAVQPLTQALKDKTPYVSAAAKQSLENIKA
jgi:HEAT repeat protein